MKWLPTNIPEVIVIEPKVFADSRGFFLESWNQKHFADHGVASYFVQDNHSRSSQGVLRGLHYQLHRPQGKLVRVVVGEVFDVAVDLRERSPTFGQWVGVHLSAANQRMLWIPEGFAHGFYVVSAQAEILYKCTEFYSPRDEHCIGWHDTDLAIQWPLEGNPPIVSEKDAAGVAFRHAEYFS